MASLSIWWTATEAWQFVALSRHTFRKRFTCWMLRIRTRLKKLAPNSSDYSYPVIGLWCAYEFDSALFLITRQRTGVQFIIFLLKLYRHQIDIFAAFYDFFFANLNARASLKQTKISHTVRKRFKTVARALRIAICCVEWKWRNSSLEVLLEEQEKVRVTSVNKTNTEAYRTI